MFAYGPQIIEAVQTDWVSSAARAAVLAHCYRYISMCGLYGWRDRYARVFHRVHKA